MLPVACAVLLPGVAEPVSGFDCNELYLLLHDPRRAEPAASRNRLFPADAQINRFRFIP
jgi:hypothetical protein